MWKIGLVLMLMIFAGGVYAQPPDDTPPYRVQVRFESVFVRRAPSLEAEPATSVFEDEWLEAVGRNLDGQWFEVRRQGRMSNLGWILSEMVEWDFAPETLPLTDFDTGLLGGTILNADPGYAIYLVENTTLRASPSRSAERITLVPFGVTVPVLERNQDASWVHINYLGYDGWISVFGSRNGEVPNATAIPEAAGLPPLEGVAVIIIPPEIQLAQVERARAYINVRREVSAGLQGFWSQVYKGEIMPCQPPPFVTEYLVGTQDVRELPEIQRYLPQMNDAVVRLNESIDPLYICGPLDRKIVDAARNDAINATLLFDAVLERLADLEENVIR